MANEVPTHPYLPRDLKLPCPYVENDKSLLEILGIFVGLTGVVMACTWLYSGRSAKVKLSTVQRMTVCWFVQCGCVHTILQGWWSVFHNTIAGDQDFLSQVWKEYSKGDSRYVSADNYSVASETAMALLVGPASFLTAWAIIQNKPSRYFLQTLVSAVHLYSSILFYSTEYNEGFIHSPIWHPRYFWLYFVFFNSFWVVIPFCLLIQAGSTVGQAQTVLDKTGTGKKSK